ncbi:hypothetical protein K461DRAFT_277151 [Myriangium duriaei CBS 260.36]|uniref:RRN7-type domain-containing protein n=1 Tax=Myriangium duriaei CBS 260.36 TaxID=1168546 RepID=A0A9P4J5Y9_9PEZI|nr:hypothetical protein K461DRAFT_277151 [Myriangium duriaei CBS 260.36]
MDAECESGNCGSRRFHVGEDGFTYCSEGHRQSQTGLVTADDDGLQPIGRRTIRQSQEDQEPVVLSGKDGLEHYLTCFQLLLWKQVHSLVNQAGYPTELETVLRDLWTLKLSTLQTRLATADRGDDATSQLFSSQGETSDSDATSTRKQSRRGDDALPRIVDGIGLIFAGTTLLRLPVTAVDLHRRIQDGQLIYYQSTQHLDPGMKAVLAGSYHQLLNPREKLSLSRLQSEIHDTFISLTTTFSISFPPLNYHLVLWRHMQALLLPLEIYPCTLRLAALLNISFNYHATNPFPTSSLSLPEQRLTALLVIATKLLFPLDSRSRPPRKPTDPAALQMDWPRWAALVRSRNSKEDQSIFQTALDTTEQDVLHMSEQRLDEYIAWFGGMYASESTSKAGNAQAPLTRALMGLFPAPASGMGEQAAEQEIGGVDNSGVREVQAALKPVRVLADAGGEEAVDRPGSGYARFYTAGELDKTAREVYTYVARETGTELDVLVRDVFALERGLERFAGTERGEDEGVETEE